MGSQSGHLYVGSESKTVTLPLVQAARRVPQPVLVHCDSTAMLGPAHITDNGRQQSWSDSKVCIHATPALISQAGSHILIRQTVLTIEADFFRKLKHIIALAANFSHIEAFSYGAVARILEAYATVHIDHTKRSEVECHPQLPFASYSSAKAAKRDSDSVAGKRIPDYTILSTTLGESGKPDSIDLGFWVEVKRFIVDDNKSDLVLSEAIEQMHVQAAFAFDSLPKGEDHYHAFVIALSRFSLLRYTRPNIISQTDVGGTPGTDNGQADLDLNIPGVPPMPDIPVVVYWNQPIFAPKLKGFSAVFLEALHCATEHLRLDRQPSWFDRKAGGTTTRAKKLLHEDQVRPAGFRM